MAKAHFLIKSEPYKYSFDQLVADGRAVWDGVRSFEARNNLRAMKKGDRVLYYHSNEGKAVVGVARVSREAYPDPTAEGVRRLSELWGESNVSGVSTGALLRGITTLARTGTHLQSLEEVRARLAAALPVERVEELQIPFQCVAASIERAAEPDDIPILDRAGGRVLAALAADRGRIVEVGTAFGYSTLWMALAQPAGGTIVTLDPDRSRTDQARGWWREANIPDAQIRVINRPALEAFAAVPAEPALSGPFDLVFIDALKHEYQAYLQVLRPRLEPGALIVADNVLWSGAVADPASTRTGTPELRAFNAAVLADPSLVATILPVGDGLLLATVRA